MEFKVNEKASEYGCIGYFDIVSQNVHLKGFFNFDNLK